MITSKCDGWVLIGVWVAPGGHSLRIGDRNAWPH